MRTEPLIFAVLGALFCQPLAAQEVPPLKLLVEGLAEDAATCGVDEAGINAAARSAARYNRIVLIPQSLYTLYVNLNVRSSGANCTANVSVSVYGYSTVNFGSKPKFAKVVFCDAGGVGNFSKGETEYLDYIKQSVDRCIAEF